ncbi:PREDICTED: cytochrome b561, DM13 and DOMON domain-containing protein At5g54830-like [Nelumbo nucifera]|uniref:Cytochrome b561, DM13 and DOMON domain-containing protein At5g54830-like n=2 Tax=Nelumbo nucifera TaxID=4432 RepID=A0A1U8ASF5_NELNU|nr:PREDICTED: cytochrome b561, DM13 and DOMON domain-containing protein At5g54830-like [Nelumbo nucifera]DAD27372.1 TPA_asm: hypothetical protein HUJ06_028840 [Nelumbo nucifera]
MAGKCASAWLLSFLLFFLFVFCDADSGGEGGCTRNSSLVDFESEFVMVQHQLRGVFKVIDDCSFRVSKFDMIEGSDVQWWGALGDAFENLTAGFVISDEKLNRTYKGESFSVRLNNVTWDQIKVIAVWDEPTASDFGHVLLGNMRNNSASPLNSSAPGSYSAPLPSPSIGNNSSGGNSQLYEQPTMFDNCKILANNYRLRWTLNLEADLIDIGLEAAQGSEYYMAFGWAHPNSSNELMLHADVAVTGFTEEGTPFADDYFITRYSECLLSKDGSVEGVCPDTIYEGSDPIGLVNNTRLVYGHRIDGVSFIRYQRPLQSVDIKYDLPVDHTKNMTVIWALGLIRPPDVLRPYYLPQNHGGPPLVTHGHLTLNVSEHVNDCLGPLEAEGKEDEDLIFADEKTTLVVVAGPALHYPNPPNPSKVLYINEREAPVLRVERGVPVKFSIQAGHDVAFYITSDPVGGNATFRNMSETIYAGGPEAEGVPASPMDLVWAPARNTPDEVYYQSLYGQKMGWKVQLVDGGLSDMYNNSVVLDDEQVTLFWTLSDKSISIAARGEKKSGYLAVAFGSGMVNSFAYVGWIDETGKGRVNTYWIDGQEAAAVHPTRENLTHIRCKSEDGIITFEFTRPYYPSCVPGSRPECDNIIDPTTPLRVVWAMGARWSENRLSEANMHSTTSSRPVRVLLISGLAEAVEDLRPVLAVHGCMMFVAWGMMFPGGILAARYLKHLGNEWYQLHIYLQYSGLAIIVLGVLFAVAELRGFFFGSVHAKFGVAAIVLAFLQPLNASIRPEVTANGEVVSSKSTLRILWEYLHVVSGRCTLVVGFSALLSGMKHLGDRYGGQNVRELNWVMMIWFLMGSLLVMHLEYNEKRKRERSFLRSNLGLDNIDERDDSIDLLCSDDRTQEPCPSEGMEVELEPLSR